MNTYERVAEWNKKAGKTPLPVGTNAYWGSLQDQYNRISEELNELYEAIENKDIKGVVDSGLDLDVVVSGLNYLSGSDYSTGIDLVLNNNDLKITTSKEIAEQRQFYWEANGEETNIVESEVGGETFYSIHRTEDDKILKYAKFPEVDLSKVIPEPVEEYFILISTEEPTEKALESNIPKLFLGQVNDESGLIEGISQKFEGKEVQLTVLNGSLVSADEF